MRRKCEVYLRELPNLPRKRATLVGQFSIGVDRLVTIRSAGAPSHFKAFFVVGVSEPVTLSLIPRGRARVETRNRGAQWVNPAVSS